VRNPPGHRELTRRQFALQAPTFEDPGYLFTDESILAWIEGHTPVRPDDRILDVAGGTGVLGRHLVRDAASCVVLDLAPDMLAAGAAAGSRDVLFIEGDATRMPFADAQFDLIVMRFAVHHIDDPEAAFREMARVGVPGARVVVADMIDGGYEHNRLERLRDPSHTTALDLGTLVDLLTDTGFEVTVVDRSEHTIDAERWLLQAHGDREAVAAALRDEAEGGPPTGLRARIVDGEMQIIQTWVLVAGALGENAW
jgi:SAM-dependent methyltransferase